MAMDKFLNIKLYHNNGRISPWIAHECVHMLYYGTELVLQLLG